MDAIEYAQCMYNVPLLVTCLQNYTVYIVILVRTCQKVRPELLVRNISEEYGKKNIQF